MRDVMTVMCERVGRRFAGCTFGNFEIGNDAYAKKRRRAYLLVEDYARQLRKNVDEGINLIIMGALGTGKDHLAVSVIRVAVGAQIDTEYIRGSQLCTVMRRHYTEFSEAVPKRFTDVPILVISDIEPTQFGATDFEERALLELVDSRWRECRPTIVTTNATGKSELTQKIGARATDRLFHRAVVTVTAWPSHRSAVQ